MGQPKKSYRPTEPWEWDVLGVYDFRRRGQLQPFYTLLQEVVPSIIGDVAEFGVYRGRSLLATAILLSDSAPAKCVWGFDSFDGLPPATPFDRGEQFDLLAASGEISSDHYARVQLNRQLLVAAGRGDDPRTASTSGDFSRTSLDLLEQKIRLLGLENCRIVGGRIETSLYSEANDLPRQLCAVLMDCDLYGCYKVALPWAWSRLERGGFIYLDEYYSLKFPGPRTATKEFCDTLNVSPTLLEARQGWERWALFK